MAVVAAGFAAYIWKKSKKKSFHFKNSNGPVEVNTVTVDSLDVSDVVQFFKSFELNPNQDNPFICTDSKKIMRMIKMPDLNDNIPVVLGSYNKNTDEIEPLQLVMVKNLSNDIVSLMGNEKLVLLT